MPTRRIKQNAYQRRGRWKSAALEQQLNYLQNALAPVRLGNQKTGAPYDGPPPSPYRPYFPPPLRVFSMNAETLACRAFRSGSCAYTMWPEV